jgi:hypothetical protein
VAVAVESITGVEVGVYVSVGGFVCGGLEVAVGTQGRGMKVLVGIAVNSTVLVTCEIVVGVAGKVGEAIVAAVEAIDVVVNGVLVANEAPGVRKKLAQAGCVRMEGSTGSMNPFGLPVRKSLFGSRLDSILASSCQ